MNKTTRALLLGMLIGDGCLKTKKHMKKDGEVSNYYEYVLCHSQKQEDYLKIKLELFHSIMGGKKPVIHYEIIQLGGVEHISCRFSRCHKSFKILHKYLYSKDDKKFITKRVLDYLTPQALAIWYMDDGGLSRSKNKVTGKITSVQMRLYTYCDEEQADTILKYFKDTWDINCIKNKYGNKDQWNIRFNMSELFKFEEIIKPYVIPSMSYKLPSTWIPRAPDTPSG